MFTNLHAAQIEAILFWKGEPMTLAELASLARLTKEETESGLEALEKSLTGRGVELMRHNDAFELRTARTHADLISGLEAEETRHDMSRAAHETLAVVLYRGPIAKVQIDYIRGVNSLSMLRTLMARGLVERTANPADQRSFLYQPTFDLLAHLGVKNLEELPDFGAFRTKLKQFEEQNTEAHDSHALGRRRQPG